MLPRARFVTLIVACSLSLFAFSQFNEPMGRLGSSSVSGTVYSSDGAPVGGVHVELRDGTTSVLVNSTYSQPNGSFELYNIPRGSYELVAQSHGSEARLPVSVHSSVLNVDLSLDGHNQSNGRGATVSVAELRVPQKARDAYAKAQQAFMKSNFPEAEKHVMKALTVCPQYAQALTLRALLELQKHNEKDGEQDLEQAIVNDPSYGTAYLALGAVYNSQGRFDDAMRAAEHGVRITPNSWQGYFELAKACVGKGMYARGLQLAKKAESLGASGFAGIHLVKAYALIPLKLYKDAKLELQAFLLHNPTGRNAETAQRMLAQLQDVEATTPAELLPAAPGSEAAPATR